MDPQLAAKLKRQQGKWEEHGNTIEAVSTNETVVTTGFGRGTLTAKQRAEQLSPRSNLGGAFRTAAIASKLGGAVTSAQRTEAEKASTPPQVGRLGGAVGAGGSGGAGSSGVRSFASAPAASTPPSTPPAAKPKPQALAGSHDEGTYEKELKQLDTAIRMAGLAAAREQGKLWGKMTWEERYSLCMSMQDGGGGGKAEPPAPAPAPAPTPTPAASDDETRRRSALLSAEFPDEPETPRRTSMQVGQSVSTGPEVEASAAASAEAEAEKARQIAAAKADADADADADAARRKAAAEADAALKKAAAEADAAAQKAARQRAAEEAEAEAARQKAEVAAAAEAARQKAAEDAARAVEAAMAEAESAAAKQLETEEAMEAARRATAKLAADTLANAMAMAGEDGAPVQPDLGASSLPLDFASPSTPQARAMEDARRQAAAALAAAMGDVSTPPIGATPGPLVIPGLVGLPEAAAPTGGLAAAAAPSVPVSPRGHHGLSSRLGTKTTPNGLAVPGRMRQPGDPPPPSQAPATSDERPPPNWKPRPPPGLPPNRHTSQGGLPHVPPASASRLDVNASASSAAPPAAAVAAEPSSVGEEQRDSSGEAPVLERASLGVADDRLASDSDGSAEHIDEEALAEMTQRLSADAARVSRIEAEEGSWAAGGGGGGGGGGGASERQSAVGQPSERHSAAGALASAVSAKGGHGVEDDSLRSLPCGGLPPMASSTSVATGQGPSSVPPSPRQAPSGVDLVGGQMSSTIGVDVFRMGSTTAQINAAPPSQVGRLKVSEGMMKPGDHRGFLLKMGGHRGLRGAAWHPRYVVLQNGLLQYYLEAFGRNAQAPEPKSAVPLRMTEVKVHSPARSSRLGRYAALSFELETHSKSFIFSAETEAELQLWLAAFKESKAPQQRGSLSTPRTPNRQSSTNEGANISALEMLALVARQPETRLEHMESAVCQEFAMLKEELARTRERTGSKTSVESEAVLALVEGLRPVLAQHHLFERRLRDGAAGEGDDSGDDEGKPLPDELPDAIRGSPRAPSFSHVPAC